MTKEGHNSMPNSSQTQLNNAIIAGDQKKVVELLSAGVSPLGTESPSPLFIALTTNSIDSLHAIFKHTKTPIDFRKECSEKAKDTEGKSAMSWLQYACVFSPTQITDDIKRYMYSNFRDFDFGAAVNAPFHYPIPEKDENSLNKRKNVVKKTTVGSLLFWVMSTESIIANFKAIQSSSENNKLIQKWIFLAPHKHMKDIPDPNTILTISAHNNLNYLLPHLNKFASDHNDETLLTTARKFEKAIKDPDIWNTKFKDRLIYSNIHSVSPAQKHTDDKIIVDVVLTNIFGSHPRALRLVPSQHSMIKAVESDIASNPEAHIIFDMQKRLEEHEHRIEHNEENVEKNAQSIEVLNKRISRLSEVQFNKIVDHLNKGLPNYVSTFKMLHKYLESYIRQRGDASLQIFPALPLRSRWKHAQKMTAISGIAASMAGIPGAPIMPFILSSLIDFINKIEVEKKSTEIFMLDTNPHVLATMISSLLINECVKTFGENPPETLTKIEKSKRVIFSNRIKSFFRTKEDKSLAEILFNDVRSQFEAKRIPLFDNINDALAYFTAKAVNTLLEERKEKPIPIEDESLETVSDYKPASVSLAGTR